MLFKAKAMFPLFVFVSMCASFAGGAEGDRPNIVLIYADDLGYGDVGCYGATLAKTPHVDRLASEGQRFTDAHSPSATCTPSRYALLTGEYAWRQKGTGILPGDAAMIIRPGRTTLAGMLQEAGYATGCVGKWHLGLGDGPLDWNGPIKPGPLEIGFDYAFIIPATGDRVPCVYVENHRVVGLDPADPIQVSYDKPVGDDPTGRDHPELLKMKLSQGHDMTIVNRISRIGYMSGGKSARWIDEDMADTITTKAVGFIEKHQNEPFFLYFATHDVHVPRVPHPRFAGTSGCGVRGDVIQQFDWSVGQIVAALDRLGLADKTLLVVTSDNGPVVDDGYADRSPEDLGGHKPAGPLWGGKYSRYEGGTRVPMIARWPHKIQPGVSDALVCQIDFLASFAALTGQPLPEQAGPDSLDVIEAILGQTEMGRTHLVEHGLEDVALRRGAWKFFPTPAQQFITTEVPKDAAGQPKLLYDLKNDLGESTNVAPQHPELVEELEAQLGDLKARGRSR